MIAWSVINAAHCCKEGEELHAPSKTADKIEARFFARMMGHSRQMSNRLCLRWGRELPPCLELLHG
jgi:hypothetical protein